LEKLTVSVEEAAKALGISRGLAYDLARTGRLPVLRLGHRYVVPTSALRRLLEEPQGQGEAGA
jgi:excisionase family DNA binding protein